jgi:hypothetical protein
LPLPSPRNKKATVNRKSYIPYIPHSLGRRWARQNKTTLEALFPKYARLLLHLRAR